MSTLEITLPDELKAVAERRIAAGRFSNLSEYVSSLIQRDRAETEDLERLLRQRLNAGPATPMTDADFDRIRERVEVEIARRRGK